MSASNYAAAVAANVHRNAYNAAFYELGLRWHWDDAIFQEGLCEEGERDCLMNYLKTQQPHLLKVYDPDFLIDAIQAAKTRCYAAMTAEGCQAGAYVNWAELQQHQVGI